VPLPRSRKTRALRAYLAATGRPHSRAHLCALLWEGPDDPRGALRWSLTKIRPLLDDARTRRLVTDGEDVAIDPSASISISYASAVSSEPIRLPRRPLSCGGARSDSAASSSRSSICRIATAIT